MENCVFCDRSQFEERLCGETKDFWIIATLGQITDGGYTLLVPKRHIECVGAMDLKILNDLALAADRVDFAVSSEYGVKPIVFEHGIVGQSIKHAHLHFVPTHCLFTKRVRGDFPGTKIVAINSWDDLKNFYATHQKPYLFWKDTEGAGICLNPPASMRYFRTVLAEAVGRPERANWCTMNQELDKKLWSETALRLKTYKF